MPITRLQSQLLRLLANRRDSESFVAGAVPINRDGPRFSSDIDIFHDREERVAGSAEADAQCLVAAGFTVEWLRRQPGIFTAMIRTDDDQTRLEWVADSDYRFFPAAPDHEFGYVLHIADLAVNKLMAAAGRREPRDIVDLLTIHESHLPAGAIAWAAVDISPGFTPEGLLAEVRRNARHPAEEYAKLLSSEPIDPAVVMRKLAVALDEAQAFVSSMPSDLAGVLFLKDGKPVQPLPTALDQYEIHRARRRGHWPTSSEIGHAMLERYQKDEP